ncbi:MAG TPA: precorrin-3B C(17)-methyltransferase [Stellaceae bacterium]|nr:precorrin-3B C(17)-methyltransferase [Stellaceae bacterium]
MSGDLPAGAAVVVLGPSALALARRIVAHLPGARLHAPASRGIAADVNFAEAMPHLAALFAAETPIVGLCAAGILVRAVAPLLADKGVEPPVVAVAEDGSAAVPLLGGHRGGNALARAIASLAGGTAAVTTASDLRLGLALDEPPPGWRIANPERIKDIAASLLAGGPVALEIEAGDGDWLRASGIEFAASAPRAIRVTDRAPGAAERALVLHPPVLALGVGCARGCEPDELRALVERSLASRGLASGAVALVASLDLKMDETAVLALSEGLGVPARFFSASALLEETPRLAHPSETVFRAVGCYGVAEGAALAAVGRDGALVVAKERSANATCAIARAPHPLDANKIGRARGVLRIIGIGPGANEWRTHEADAALAAASDIVGLRLYLDLLGPACAGKTLHESALGDETARARLALDLAGQGQNVALVSSGDAGIYGLAALVFELLERAPEEAWRHIDLAVVPGISALQAAAARLGAPLGHDFCVISLSDLMTPWAVIERRLEAAAAGDFVVALYNPRSTRRQWQLARALEILRRARGEGVPVALARNLGRSGERVTVTTLGRVEVEAIDMLTLVIAGSSATRLIAGTPLRLYTPRGYPVGAKAETDESQLTNSKPSPSALRGERDEQPRLRPIGNRAGAREP